MRTATAAYIAAAQVTDTSPITRVAIDWSGTSITGSPPVDLSKCAKSAAPQADLTTDMPAQARLITGYSARSCDVTLGGQYDPTDETKTAAELFEPYSSGSPLYGQDWTGVTGPLVHVFEGLDITTQQLAAQLSIDPTFEAGIKGWTAAGTPLPTIASSTTHVSQGTKSMLITWAAGITSRPGAVFTLATIPGVTYDVQADVYVPAANPAVQLVAGNTLATGQPSTVTAAFQTLLVRFTAAALTTTITVTPATAPTAGQQAWVDNVIITQSQELYRQFVGYVDSVSFNRSSGEVTLHLIDTRSRLNTIPSIPEAAAVVPGVPLITPGLSSQWVLDQVLRANGVYSSPPMRSQCRYFMSGHGSVWPERGSVTADGQLQSQAANLAPRAVTFSRNQWGSADTPNGIFAIQSLTSPLDLQSGTAYIEAYANVSTVATGSAGTAIDILLTNLTVAGAVALPAAIVNGSDTLEAGMGFDPATGIITVQGTIGRSSVHGSGLTATFSTVGGQSGWHKLGVLFSSLTTTGGVVVVYLDDVQVATRTITTLTPVTPTALSTISVQGQAAVEGVQVTAESSFTPAVFTPGAYLDTSLNNLLAVPAIDTTSDCWTLVQLIAEAETATAGFDEDGIFRYMNRDNVPTVPSATVTSLTQIKDLQFEVNEANRARQVTSRVLPVGVADAAVIWTATEAIYVPPLATVTTFAHLQSPAMFVPAGFTEIPNNGLVTFALNGCRMSRAADGSIPTNIGDVRIIAQQIDASTVLITMTSLSVWPVWVVSSTAFSDSSAGTAAMSLVGRSIEAVSVDGTLIPPGSTDNGSQVQVTSTYGTGSPVVSLPDNVFRQITAAVQATTDDMLGDLIRPRPMITTFTIVGDARLQLGDRINISDSGAYVDGGYGAGAVMADDAILSSVHPSMSGDGTFTQEIVARMWANPRQWVLGQVGKSEIGATTWI